MNVNRSWGWMIWTVCLLPLTFGSSLKLATAVPLTDVVFADPNLQACVQIAASVEGWSQSEEVTELACAWRGITTLHGIEALANLSHLNIAINLIADLSPLAHLSNLTDLDLGF